MSNKIIVPIIFLLPALGVVSLYLSVKNDMADRKAHDASGQPASTKVIHYTSPAALPDGIQRRSQSGSCRASSLAAPYRSDTWRCMSGNTIHDPCFSLPHKDSVVCGVNPQTGNSGFELKLTMPLPPSSTASDGPPGVWGWQVQLSDGSICTPFTGTRPMVNGAAAYYGCLSDNPDVSVVLMGDLKNTAPVWTATRAILSTNGVLSSVKTSGEVSIATVWQ